jgi:hypothetical protein
MESPAASASASRRPDGVALEPAAAVPAPASRAEANGVVSLRAPVTPSKIADLVASFFSGWEHESLEALEGLLTADAGPIEARAKGKSTLVEGWRQRMHAHEYGRIAGVDLVRPDRIQRFSRDELDALGRRAVAEQMLADDVYVRVPLETTGVSGERLFSDVLILIVRPNAAGLRIAAYGEAER